MHDTQPSPPLLMASLDPLLARLERAGLPSRLSQTASVLRIEIALRPAPKPLSAPALRPGWPIRRLHEAAG